DRYPNSIYIRRDIYNTRAFLRRCNFNSYTPTSTFFKVFNNNEVEYIKKIDLNNMIRLLGIVFIFIYYIYIIQQFPKVIIIDNIYNTNRFNYPFY
ncbi:hypothetical protein GE21DRAFT_1221207, partial [Neurospora crassa]